MPSVRSPLGQSDSDWRSANVGRNPAGGFIEHLQPVALRILQIKRGGAIAMIMDGTDVLAGLLQLPMDRIKGVAVG